MKQLRKSLISFFLSATIGMAAVEAQEPVWTLERCLELAGEGNLTLKTAAANVDLASVGENHARAARKPMVGLASDIGWVSDVMHIDMPGTEIPSAGN